MNIRRFINQNKKLIWRIIIIIVFVLFAIKSLNSYYEADEEKRKIEANESATNNQKDEEIVFSEQDYSVENDSIEKTMASFVNYCNKKEVTKAYEMLTDECKKAMFPTVEDFEKIYINNVYKVERQYELTKWSTDGSLSTYIVKLYGNILATGNTDESTEEYYTFVEEENGKYKININNYIYGEDRNIEKTVNNISIKIDNVDVYEEYESARITITNKSSKVILLTGNKYKKNIYLQNAKGTAYSALHSEFDGEEIIMNPNSVKTFTIRFNKTYNSVNEADYLVLSDVILDYEEYSKSEDKTNYTNRTSLKVQYQK